MPLHLLKLSCHYHIILFVHQEFGANDSHGRNAATSHQTNKSKYYQVSLIYLSVVSIVAVPQHCSCGSIMKLLLTKDRVLYFEFERFASWGRSSCIKLLGIFGGERLCLGTLLSRLCWKRHLATLAYFTRALFSTLWGSFALFQCPNIRNNKNKITN